MTTPHDSTPIDSQFKRIQMRALMVGLVALIPCAVGWYLNPAQFFQSYLYAFLFWNGLAIGSLGIYLLHNVVGGNWGAVIRRFLEAGAKTLPLSFILLLPIMIFGMQSVYLWAQPQMAADPIIHHKAPYLNVPFFIARAVGYFAIWIFIVWRLVRLSELQDRTGDAGIQEKMRAFSAPALLVFTLTGTFAFFDWIMSLEPYWFSTIYGAMYLIGQMLQTFGFVIALLIVLAPRKPFKDVLKTHHFHDLGNLLFAFTMLWAYLSFSQFIIIWAGNLPEEIPWYIRRFSGGFGVIAVAISLFHFALPFFLLLHRFVKKTPSLLYKVAVGMVCIRLLDIFWVVEPAFRQRGLNVHWLDFVTPVAIGGLWIAAFVWRLRERPLLPLHDARLANQTLEVEV